MKNSRKWMLGAALMAGGLGLGATTAHAAQFGVYIGAPVAYVPPCPGPGYVWQAGYESEGYWVPGRWAFVGYGDRGGYGYTRVYHDRDDYRHYDRDHDRGWDRDGDRHWDRERHGDRDRGWGRHHDDD